MGTAPASGLRRAFDRVKALSVARIGGPLLVGELVIAMAKALKASSHPAVYMLPDNVTPAHDFVVWRGTETMTDELRVCLRADFWPAPANAPRPHEMTNAPPDRRVVSVVLWGEGADEQGPWEGLWRERLVRHGLYAAFVAPSKRIAVMLMSRGPDDPPFTRADEAFVSDCSPLIAAAMDTPCSTEDDMTAFSDGALMRLNASGKIEAMSQNAREMLRDLEGGGPGAFMRGVAKVEGAVAAVAAQTVPPALGFAAPPVANLAADDPFRQAQLEMAQIYYMGSARAHLLRPKTVRANALGRFELTIVPLINQTGVLEWSVTLARRVEPLLIALRGALEIGATGREIDLISPLSKGASVETIAATLEVSVPTVRTMVDRLAERASAPHWRDILPTLMDIGRRVER